MAFEWLNGTAALVYTQLYVMVLALSLKELCSRSSQLERRWWIWKITNRFKNAFLVVDACSMPQHTIHPPSYIPAFEWCPYLDGIVEDGMANYDGKRGLCETASTLKVLHLASAYEIEWSRRSHVPCYNPLMSLGWNVQRSRTVRTLRACSDFAACAPG